MSTPEEQRQEQRDPEAVREEIDKTRAELGETVEALTEKADLKGQAKARLEERRAALRSAQEQAKARAEELRTQLSGATPEDARRAAEKAAASAKERPGRALGVAFALGLLCGRLLRRG
jgi:ElaB/YqjD/DUF883 family membrane-anchored ribosome-binding protein